MATPIRKKRNFKALQLNVAGGVGGSQAPQGAFTVGAVPNAEAPALASTSTTSSTEELSLRTAPTAVGPGLKATPGKRRPPPMTLKAPKINSSSGMVSALEPTSNSHELINGTNPRGGSGVDDEGGLASAPVNNVNVRRNTLHAVLSDKLANLNEGAAAEGERVNYEFKNEDFEEMQDLGQGNGGSVKKAKHLPTGTIMAKKTVLIDAKPAVRKQILRELQIMHDCHSKYIISFYGAFLAEPNICICMEFADKGSLDSIYKKIGPIDIDVVGKIALGVLEGLTYLYDVHRIIHRDIKPSNILFNSRGEVKICDFGVSGELINSIADTFVGTSTYMSPERIQGAQYTVKSDVWSLGISLIEIALGRFPFSQSDSDDDSDDDFEGTLSPATMGALSIHDVPDGGFLASRRTKKEKKAKKDKRKSKGVSLQGGGMTMSILELLQHIVNEPAPRLTPEGRYPREAEDFIDACLLKNPEERKTPKDLLEHPWIEISRHSSVDLEAWASTF